MTPLQLIVGAIKPFQGIKNIISLLRQWYEQGFEVNPGSDTDIDIITVNVTGEPKISWDESEDAFSVSHNFKKPAQDIISGDYYGTTLSAAQKIPFNRFWVSGRGITYNSGTRRFTVSKSGVYRITMNPFKNTGGSGTWVVIGVNTDTPTISNNYGHCYSNSSVYETMCINSVVSLNANDYIVFYLGGGSLFNLTTNTYNQFSIELIG
jgi:hypothetical protein